MDSDAFYIIATLFIVVCLIWVWVASEDGWEKKLREMKQRHAREKEEKKQKQVEKEDAMEQKGNTPEGREPEGKKQELESIEVEIGTRDLLLRTLQEMGCPVSFDENRNICFAYQGKHFVALASNEYHTITVHYPWWEQCSLYDVEQFSRLKNVINEANARWRVATFYTVSNEGDVVGVHSRRDFVLIPQIPQITDYLQAMLNDFFATHHFVDCELERQKNQ